MKINDTISSFLKNQRDSVYFESSKVTYNRKLNVFLEYLSRKCDLSDSNWESILRGLDEKSLTLGIVYYIEEYGVQFTSTIDNYLSVISSYFRFLRDDYKIYNSVIDSEEKLKKFKKAVYAQIKAYSLIKSTQKDPINNSIFPKLIEYCDECIVSFSKNSIKNQGYNKPFTNFVSSIITKLVILTGLKPKIIKSLSRKDYNVELNKIKINNYWIHLPDNYSLQFKKYIEIRDLIVLSNSVESLFITREGKELNSNSSMFEVLLPIIGSKEAESVAKAAIMQLIKGEVPLGLIKKLTGFSYETCLHCVELIEEEHQELDKNEFTRKINSRIRELTIFDML